MPLVPMRDLLVNAEKGGYAVPAFNVSDLNQAVAILEAAVKEKSPVIVMAIAGVSAYDDQSLWWSRLRDLVAKCEMPVALHLDHGLTVEDCFDAIKSGFSSVMIDASRDPSTGKPATLEQNIATTRKVVEYAHKLGITVEGEIGTVGGGGEGASLRLPTDIEYTDPDQAVEFVKQTQVDALAVGVGTSHGSVKFSPGTQPHLEIELITKLHSLIPDAFLVLHGSSSIIPEYVTKINEYHGKLDPSCGISDEEKIAAIKVGVRKINQGTDSHLAWTSRMRETLANNPAAVDPCFYLKPAIKSMEDLARQRMQIFGSSGKAD